jgi:hypothetical protein
MMFFYNDDMVLQACIVVFRTSSAQQFWPPDVITFQLVIRLIDCKRML